MTVAFLMLLGLAWARAVLQIVAFERIGSTECRT